MTNRTPRYDGDGDGQIDNAAVAALVNMSVSDVFSQYPLANSDLTNSSVTVAGNSIGLGGSSAIAHGDLSDAPSGAHHTRYSNEEAQDAVGNNYDATLSYDDATPSFGIASGGVDTTQLAASAVTTTEVDGSGGSNGQVLTTDGTASGVSWGSVSGGEAWSTLLTSANATASDNEEHLIDTSGGSVTLTLPTPSQGTRVRAMRTTSANSATIARSGTENINRDASDLTLTDLESVELVSDGTDWFIV